MQVSIRGRAFAIDGRSTYAGRAFEGHSVQGLLFDVGAVQATCDDANPETRRHWAYPESSVWDAECNVREFCEALPSWRDHGVLAFTVNIEGRAQAERGRCLPPPSLLEAVPYVLLHRNGNRAAELEAAIRAVQSQPAHRQNPKPSSSTRTPQACLRPIS